MNIGFIGAGKVGCTLGRYFAEGGLHVAGYYSIPGNTSLEAAHFTNTHSFDSAEDLIKECDCVFVTVPDGLIQDVWNDIRRFDLEDKIICHCSGAMTARDAFDGIGETGASGYSVHPLFAVSNRYSTYLEMPGVFFTIEGDAGRMDEMTGLIGSLGNPVRTISGEDKTMYHCAAAAASNLICGVLDMSFDLMERCGFSEKDAREAMGALIRGNVEHVLDVGTQEGLTGPVERNDTGTVGKHLDCLEQADAMQAKEIYRLISCRLTDMAANRHNDRDYSQMRQLLGGRKQG